MSYASLPLPAQQTLDRAYYRAFVVACLICWSPFKALAYVAPFLVCAIICFQGHRPAVARRLTLWLVAGLAIILFYDWITPDFVLTSGLLTLLTYGTFAFLIALSGEQLRHPALLERMLAFVRVLVMIEAGIGILQAAYGTAITGGFDLANGDYVQGTIDITGASRGFGNPMFAVNMALMLLALTPSALRQRKGRLAYALGAFSLLLASVMHVLGLLFIAGTLMLLWFRPQMARRLKAALLAGSAVFVLLAFVLLRTNIATAQTFYQLFAEGAIPKAVMVARSLTVIPEDNPRVPWVGFGPGQFTSRAGLIGTGYYFGGPLEPRPLPLIPTAVSEPQDLYLVDLWYASATADSGSSTIVPYFSWLSVATEFGFLVLLGLAAYLARMLWRLRTTTGAGAQQLLAACTAAGILLIFLLGIQENYWETTQAILCGAMLLKVMYTQVQPTQA